MLEHLNIKLKYLAGIIALKSSPEGQSFNFSSAVSPFFTFCRSANNVGITKNERTARVSLYSMKMSACNINQPIQDFMHKTIRLLRHKIIKSEIQEKHKNSTR